MFDAKLKLNKFFYLSVLIIRGLMQSGCNEA